MAKRIRTPRPPAPTGTIAVATPDPHFGGPLDITWTSTDPIPWAHLVVTRDGVVVCEAYQRLDHFPQGNFTLGPTPSWYGGAAEGRVDLVPFLVSTGNFGSAYASAAFSVTA